MSESLFGLVNARLLMLQRLRSPGRWHKLRQGVSFSALVLVLQDMARQCQARPSCYTSYDAIAKRIGKAKSTVQLACDALRRLGWLKVEPRGGWRERLPSLYDVEWPAITAVADGIAAFPQERLFTGSENRLTVTENRSTTTEFRCAPDLPFEERPTTTTNQMDGDGGNFAAGKEKPERWRLGWLPDDAPFLEKVSEADRLFEQMVAAGQGGVQASDRELVYAVLLKVKDERDDETIPNAAARVVWLFSGGRDRWEGRNTRDTRERARALMAGRDAP
jgi:hypothetical protein